MKRTVVDLSFSFFMPPKVVQPVDGSVIDQEQSGTLIDSCPISHRYRFAKNVSEHCIAIKQVMYKSLVS